MFSNQERKKNKRKRKGTKKDMKKDTYTKGGGGRIKKEPKRHKKKGEKKRNKEAGIGRPNIHRLRPRLTIRLNHTTAQNYIDDMLYHWSSPIASGPVVRLSLIVDQDRFSARSHTTRYFVF